MNKDGSYTGYDNETNMILFKEFLEFTAKNYKFSELEGYYVTRDGANIVKTEDIYWAFMKTKVKRQE